MLETRHLRPNPGTISAILLFVVFGFSSCKVYTVDKSQLETTLEPVSKKQSCPGLGLNKLLSMYHYQFNNQVDTLRCNDEVGTVKTKRLKFDSKITVITADNRSFKFYAQTLYIWKDEYLIGERIAPSLRSPNYYPVKLKDIVRIEVRG